MRENEIKQIIQDWLEKWVIGFGLCPFAAKPYLNHQVRIVVFQGDKVDQLPGYIMEECKMLLATTPDEIDTTLIVCPDILSDFMEYWAFAGLLEEVMSLSGYEGIFQLATFHPEYRFEGSPKEDAANFTNRAPFPTFHLLREESLSKAIDGFPDIEGVPDKNIQRMRRMSLSLLKEQLSSWRKE